MKIKMGFWVATVVVFNLGFGTLSYAETTWFTQFRHSRFETRAPVISQESLFTKTTQDCLAIAARFGHRTDAGQCEALLLESAIVKADAVRYLASVDAREQSAFFRLTPSERFDLIEKEVTPDKLAWFALFGQSDMGQTLGHLFEVGKIGTDILRSPRPTPELEVILAKKTGHAGAVGGGVTPVSGGFLGSCLKPVAWKLPGSYKPSEGGSGPSAKDPSSPDQAPGKSGVKPDCKDVDPAKGGKGGQTSQDTAGGEDKPKDDGKVKDDPADDLKDKDGKTGAEKDKEAADKKKKEEYEKNKKEIIDELKSPNPMSEDGPGNKNMCAPSPVNIMMDCLKLFDTEVAASDLCKELAAKGMPAPDGLNCPKSTYDKSALDAVKEYLEKKKSGEGPEGGPNPQ